MVIDEYRRAERDRTTHRHVRGRELALDSAASTAPLEPAVPHGHFGDVRGAGERRAFRRNVAALAPEGSGSESERDQKSHDLGLTKFRHPLHCSRT